MNSLPQEIGFTIPIALEAHQIAQRLYQHHPFPKKARKIYLNTLSTYAAKVYLTCLQIATDWPSREGENESLQLFEDTATLTIAAAGKLECRPVLPEEDFCFIPLEARSERLGFLAVKLNAELTEATLIGFLSPQKLERLPLQEKIALQEFEPFEKLLDALEPDPLKSKTMLQAIADKLVDLGWQTFSSLVVAPAPRPAFSFRGAKLPRESPLLSESYQGIKLGRILDFDRENKVIFALGIRAAEDEELEINLDFLPEDRETYLPPDLEVSILDESDEVMMYKRTKQKHTNFPFQFFGEAGDSFRVRVAFGDRTLLESFYL